MKKTYIIPASEIYTAAPVTTIATSPSMDTVDSTNTITGDTKDNYDYGQSRNNNVWEEQW